MKIHFTKIFNRKQIPHTFKKVENAVKKYYQLTNSASHDFYIYTPLIIEASIPGTYQKITAFFSKEEIKKLVETKGFKKTAEFIEEITFCKGYHNETPF